MKTMLLKISADGCWNISDPANDGEWATDDERVGLDRDEIDAALADVIALGYSVTVSARHARRLRAAGLTLAGVTEI